MLLPQESDKFCGGDVVNTQLFSKAFLNTCCTKYRKLKKGIEYLSREVKVSCRLPLQFDTNCHCQNGGVNELSPVTNDIGIRPK